MPEKLQDSRHHVLEFIFLFSLHGSHTGETEVIVRSLFERGKKAVLSSFHEKLPASF